LYSVEAVDSVTVYDSQVMYVSQSKIGNINLNIWWHGGIMVKSHAHW